MHIYGSYRKNKTGVPFFLEHPVECFHCIHKVVYRERKVRCYLTKVRCLLLHDTLRLCEWQNKTKFKFNCATMPTLAENLGVIFTCGVIFTWLGKNQKNMLLLKVLLTVKKPVSYTHLTLPTKRIV